MATRAPKDPSPVVPMDKQEKAERTEAADAYAGESPEHFVSYVNDSVQTSVSAMLPIRQLQDECWAVFNEEEPYNYAFKEEWQARALYPKPFKLVQSGSAVIRKIFELEFLSVEEKKKNDAATFWQELLITVLGRNYANFPICFADATGFALAIGQSLEMIPYWVPGEGLQIAMVEPANIHRDPDALSRQPWSGEYWIHQEYMAYHQLKYMEDQGRYEKIPSVGPGGSYGSAIDPHATEEEKARRKNMLYSKGKYRTGVLTYEFWGTVVSPQGEIVLPNATYTVAGDKVISKPKPSPYPTMRWPGVSYSAIPNMLRYDGRGLIQGIRSLWYLMCNLLSLHADHLNWVVNPMMEMDILSLVDQQNTDVFPGKVYQTHGTQQGQQVVRPIDFRSNVGDIMAILNFMDQRHQDGGLMDYATMGLPGYRAEVTKGEAAQNLDQSMILVGSMGKNVEDGALNFIKATIETIRINMTYDELVAIMGEEAALPYKAAVSDDFPTGVNLPDIGKGTFHVSGISGVMKDQEVMRHLNEMMPMFMTPNSPFLPYLEPYYYLKAWERRTNIRDEGVVISEDKAKPILAAQQAAQEQSIEQQKQAEAAAAAEKQGLVDRHAAQAEKFRGEGAAKDAQALKFSAEAGAATPLQQGSSEGGAPEEMPPGAQGGLPEGLPMPEAGMPEGGI
jgi:hypothetical protein